MYVSFTEISFFLNILVPDNAKWTTKKEACDVQASVIIIGDGIENDSYG